MRTFTEGADRVLAAALFIMGVAQIVATPAFFPRIHEPAAWFAAGGALLTLTGAMNFMRIRYGA
ncbi:MAG TPA: hypothetical protein VFT12_01070, partial [Thermoanaerobaculia bacterium]|nr:hypothetical protein [Thermoanaerobaculia bacterium]